MKEVILIEASNNAKNQKKYKCPYCDQIEASYTYTR